MTPDLAAMSGKHLEWAFFSSTDDFPCPYIWHMLDRDVEDVHVVDETPCWGIIAFSLLLPGGLGEERIRCRIERPLLEDVWLFKIWWYEVLDENGNFVAADIAGIVYDAVVLRQIPCHVIFNCCLSVVDDGHFLAIFSTLAGNELQRAKQPVPRVLTARFLRNLISRTALANGFLQSQNQKVHILLNGFAEQISEHAILWDKERQNGWLQNRGCHG